MNFVMFYKSFLVTSICLVLSCGDGNQGKPKDGEQPQSIGKNDESKTRKHQDETKEKDKDTGGQRDIAKKMGFCSGPGHLIKKNGRANFEVTCTKNIKRIVYEPSPGTRLVGGGKMEMDDFTITNQGDKAVGNAKLPVRFQIEHDDGSKSEISLD